MKSTNLSYSEKKAKQRGEQVIFIDDRQYYKNNMRSYVRNFRNNKKGKN